MTAFDSKVSIIGFRLIEDANEPKIQTTVVLTIGLPVPVSQDQAAMIPLGTIAFDLDKKSAGDIGKALAEEAEQLSNPSGLAVASNVNDLKDTAKIVEEFKRGPKN